MSIKEYISSGVLEAYVLGDLSLPERAELERRLTQYPELADELSKIEETFEQLAQVAAMAPDPCVKQKIAQAALSEKKVVSLPVTKIDHWRWAAAASVVLALAASYLAYDYRGRWIRTTIALNQLIDRSQQVALDYSQINLQLEKLQGDFSVIENEAFAKVVLQGTVNSPESKASVYWNADTKEAYLSIQTLCELSQAQQFQLWAIVEGKPVDVGVFDSGFKGLLKMKNIQNPSAFAITIEPRGGKPTPTLETMQVLGALAKG